MKKCPYCAEEINEEAKKCRYCGEFLDDELKSHKSNQPLEQKVVVENKQSGLVTFLIILSIIALIIIIFGF